ncbi:TRAP transporter small permease [Microbacterium sp. MPKO10]|uniref:TRAP transporter small permease n=1 Tax=Microbacterium sp. MPKO10 TaxID=2989818 RepID=UPI0022356431|nr:TRAP transporter small permease [Microbacterium sp. MPKO10]MCW4458652.1 TRAP transporter small permease [Microbacterium sp. MPKO10]
MIGKIVQGAAWLLGVVAAAGVGLLMVTVIADTASRYMFSNPIFGANDYSRYWWMIIIVFGALGLAEKRNEHIEALVLENLMPPRLKIVWRYIRAAVITAVLASLLYAAIPTAILHQSRGEYAPGSEIPIWPTRYMLVVGVAVFWVVVIMKLIEDHRVIRSGMADAEAQR